MGEKPFGVSKRLIISRLFLLNSFLIGLGTLTLLPDSIVAEKFSMLVVEKGHLRTKENCEVVLRY